MLIAFTWIYLVKIFGDSIAKSLITTLSSGLFKSLFFKVSNIEKSFPFFDTKNSTDFGKNIYEFKILY